MSRKVQRGSFDLCQQHIDCQFRVHLFLYARVGAKFEVDRLTAQKTTHQRACPAMQARDRHRKRVPTSATPNDKAAHGTTSKLKALTSAVLQGSHKVASSLCGCAPGFAVRRAVPDYLIVARHLKAVAKLFELSAIPNGRQQTLRHLYGHNRFCDFA